jgi:hypothetical protein
MDPGLYPDKGSGAEANPDPGNSTDQASSVYYTPGWSKTQPVMKPVPVENPELTGELSGFLGALDLASSAAACRARKVQ